MVTKVTRAKRVAKRRVSHAANDQRLLARAQREDDEAGTVRVSRETLRQLKLRLRDAQHAVVRAPNRAVPLRDYGPIAALQAYDGIQEVVQGLEDILAVQP